MINSLTALASGYAVSLGLLAGMAGAFITGGVVKGTLGVGLPLVMVPLLTLFMPSPEAIALMAVPVLVSNLWQAYDSGVSLHSVRRFAPLIITSTVSTILTVPMTLAMSPAILNLMVAGAVILAVLLMAFKPEFEISARRERFTGALAGSLSGMLGGVSSLTGPIIISYLTALKLKREEFVASVSIIYICSAIPLYGSMAVHGRLGTRELAWSLVGLIPLGFGMMIGKWLRGRLSEIWFRRMLLIFLCILAAMLVLKAVL